MNSTQISYKSYVNFNFPHYYYLHFYEPPFFQRNFKGHLIYFSQVSFLSFRRSLSFCSSIQGSKSRYLIAPQIYIQTTLSFLSLFLCRNNKQNNTLIPQFRRIKTKVFQPAFFWVNLNPENSQLSRLLIQNNMLKSL